MKTAEPTLTIERIFDAPRELVWKVWTEPKHILHWWGPKDFIAPYCTVDLKVGGKFHFCMRAPDGNEYWNVGVLREITAPEKIVWVMYFSDKDGHIRKPTDYGMGADFPSELHDAITFDVHEGKRTKLTLRRNTPVSVSKKYGEGMGWNQSLDRFAVELARAGEPAKKIA
ncbi:MAG TPA: SRPBCC domain-containing protein [Verrucomicrobiae bacterium]|jgi:uncharacterized protein YndB with AHSA1/START domain|nr:SRPBCC domain-containing protein [Verrucomicrobiae bacterium]